MHASNWFAGNNLYRTCSLQPSIDRSSEWTHNQRRTHTHAHTRPLSAGRGSTKVCRCAVEFQNLLTNAPAAPKITLDPLTNNPPQAALQESGHLFSATASRPAGICPT